MSEQHLVQNMRNGYWRTYPIQVAERLGGNSFLRQNTLPLPFSFTQGCSRKLKSSLLGGSSRSLQNVTYSSTSRLVNELYHPEHDVENLEGYVPGGFHPTAIKDTFCDGRYKIVHKLGFGGYSTIWLARDQIRQRFVSLKILIASASRSSNEGSILCLLQNGNSSHPGRQFIPTLLDQFTFAGPNGQHLCLVGEPYGCSVSKSKEDNVDLMFPFKAARSVAAQLVMGLSYLHDCGICHGGASFPTPLVLFRANRITYRFTYGQFPSTNSKL